MQIAAEPRENINFIPENRDMKLEIGMQQFNRNMQKPVISEPRSVKEILEKMGLLIQK